MDSPSQGRRGQFHRGGRRGPDRRGQDRRGPLPAPDQSARGDAVDVEQIMREIRARIAQRHGVELTDQQVQELAARRLESILDPRTVNPSLLDQLRKTAAVPPVKTPTFDPGGAPYTFEDYSLYESPNAFVRFMRKLLNPLLKLFFNPNPLIRALNVQARLNVETLQRESERVKQQAEWNALHFELLRRLVTEVARVSLEMQSLTLKVESLSAKVDFNERRVRGIEGMTQQQARPTPVKEPVAASPAAAEAPQAAETPADGGQAEAPRRRRRRRRGRRAAVPGESGVAAPAGASIAESDADGADAEEDVDVVPEEAPSEGLPSATPEGAVQPPELAGAPPAPAEDAIREEEAVGEAPVEEQARADAPVPAAEASVPMSGAQGPVAEAPAPAAEAPTPDERPDAHVSEPSPVAPPPSEETPKPDSGGQ